MYFIVIILTLIITPFIVLLKLFFVLLILPAFLYSAGGFGVYLLKTSSLITMLFSIIGVSLSIILLGNFFYYMIFKVIKNGDSFLNIFLNMALLVKDMFDTFVNFLKNVFQVDNDKKGKKDTKITKSDGKVGKISCNPNDLFPFMSFSSMFGIILTCIFLPIVFLIMLIPIFITLHKSVYIGADLAYSWFNYRSEFIPFLNKNMSVLVIIFFLIASIVIFPYVFPKENSEGLDPMNIMYELISLGILFGMVYFIFSDINFSELTKSDANSVKDKATKTTSSATSSATESATRGVKTDKAAVTAAVALSSSHDVKK